MRKYRVRIDYGQRGADNSGPHDERPERLATLFRDAGYEVNITRGRRPNITANDDDAVVIAKSAPAAEVLKLLVEAGGFKIFYVKCGRLKTGVEEAQVLIRLGG
jgi:hypothetical protein